MILGSGSKARREILQGMGYDFEVRVPHIDEKALRIDDPYQLPLLLANAKADELKRQIQEPVILITSDSIALYDGHVREKPETPEQAKEFLRSYGNKPVEVATAVVVTNTETGKVAHGVEAGIVYFHKIPEQVIDDLVRLGQVMYAAGGFIAEDPTLRKYIVHIEGNMDTIMGLPKILTKKLIEQVS